MLAWGLSYVVLFSHEAWWKRSPGADRPGSKFCRHVGCPAGCLHWICKVQTRQYAKKFKMFKECTHSAYIRFTSIYTLSLFVLINVGFKQHVQLLGGFTALIPSTLTSMLRPTCRRCQGLFERSILQSQEPGWNSELGAVHPGLGPGLEDTSRLVRCIQVVGCVSYHIMCCLRAT